MEVTCEQCSTAYDFDDALVSERGTTVKCTTCGHQFKVRRATAAAAPDLWIVRTVDGREIEFAALRELQAAIQEVRVTRDDVLVRGSGRPRRMGSIAELEPFFNRVGVTVPPTQRRARTLAGGVAAVQPNETSVVFSLPKIMGAALDHDAPPSSYRRGSIPPPPPSRRTLPPPMPMVGRGSIPPPPPMPIGRGSIPPPPPSTVGGRRPPSARTSGPGIRFDEPNLDDFGDEHSNAGIERVSALPPPPPPLRRSVPPPPPMFPAAEPPAPPREATKAATANASGEVERTQMSKMPAPTPDKPAPAPEEKSAPKAIEAPPPKQAPARVSDRPPAKEKPAEPAPVVQDKPPADKPVVAAKTEEAPAPQVAPAPAQEPAEERVSQSSTSDTSDPSAAPIPSSRRVEEPFSEPRHSGPVHSRRAGAARWIVGFVLVGCTALAAVTIGPKLLSKPVAVAPKADSRVDTFVAEGDRALGDGDLDAAKEAYVKASALVDKDLRIELRLARVAIIRADVSWLETRLLEEANPDRASKLRELDMASSRAVQAVDRAAAIAPNDPDVVRSRIDTLRLLGKLAEARKLVATLPKQADATQDETLFAMLDLAEPSPTWPTVIERLSQAARSEQNLGRARAMLVYALVQSGDAAKAKVELNALVALPKPHPLIGAFRAFIERADKAAGNGPAPAASAAAPANDAEALQQAIDAMGKDDLERATSLLEPLEKRVPVDSKVLTAAGQLAQKKKNAQAAVKYYEQAIAADKNNLEAMNALAELKWDSGGKQGASILYRQIIERGKADDPIVLKAKQRFSAYMSNLE